MTKVFKRIQFIHRINNGKCNKFWQNIDFNRMITLEHVWNNIKHQLVLSTGNENQKFSYYKTKQILPKWYHIELLNDNEQIFIDECEISAPSNKSIPSKPECFKNISKKKQLNTSITNRSFVITNKFSISNDFYEQWEAGKMHKNTQNCQMIF